MTNYTGLDTTVSKPIEENKVAPSTIPTNKKDLDKAAQLAAAEKRKHERLGDVNGKEAKLDPNSEAGKAIAAFAAQTKSFLESKEFANIQPDATKESIRQRLIAVLGKPGADGNPEMDLQFTGGFDKVSKLFLGDGHYTKIAPLFSELKKNFDAYVAAKAAPEKATDRLIAARTGMTFEDYTNLKSNTDRFSALMVPLDHGKEVTRAADEAGLSLVAHAHLHPEKYSWVPAAALKTELEDLKRLGVLTPAQNKRLGILDKRLLEVQADFTAALEKAQGHSDVDAKLAAYNASAVKLNSGIVDAAGNSPKQAAITASKAEYPQATYAEKGVMTTMSFAKLNSVMSSQRLSQAKSDLIDSLDKLAAAKLDVPIDPRVLKAMKEHTAIKIKDLDPENPKKNYNHLVDKMKLSERDKALLALTNQAYEEKTSFLHDSRMGETKHFASSFEQQAAYFAAYVDINQDNPKVSFKSNTLAARRGRAITAFGPYGDQAEFGPGNIEKAVAAVREIAADPMKSLNSKTGTKTAIKKLIHSSQELELNEALTTDRAYKNGAMHLRDGVLSSAPIIKGFVIPLAIGFGTSAVWNALPSSWKFEGKSPTPINSGGNGGNSF